MGLALRVRGVREPGVKLLTDRVEVGLATNRRNDSSTSVYPNSLFRAVSDASNRKMLKMSKMGVPRIPKLSMVPI